MQSVLPETYEEDTIIGMLPGDIGYTVPWAMWPDTDRILWINGRYSIDREPGGPNKTTNMKIQRTVEGVIVYEDTIGDHKYHVGRSAWDAMEDKLPVQLR